MGLEIKQQKVVLCENPMWEEISEVKMGVRLMLSQEGGGPCSQMGS